MTTSTCKATIDQVQRLHCGNETYNGWEICEACAHRAHGAMMSGLWRQRHPLRETLETMFRDRPWVCPK